MAFKYWDSICTPKLAGGLGFKNFFDINRFMLAKLGWLMASMDDRLWVTMLAIKYLRGKSFFRCISIAGDLCIWKGILSTRNLVRRESYFRIGNGWRIDVWEDPWVP